MGDEKQTKFLPLAFLLPAFLANYKRRAAG
jgi:hypothetical protein